jgi:hypothetical protein
MRGHCYDALVGLAGCDKSLPGMMMAMVRLNVPSVFIYGGSILPGRFEGRDVTVQDLFEAVGQHQAGNMTDEHLHRLEMVACPSAGACGGQFTANTMACVSEAIGLALFNSSGAPAPYESRDQYGVASGHRGDEAARGRHPPARHRHPPEPRERRPRRRLHRRLDQRRACTCPPSPTRPGSTSTSRRLRDLPLDALLRRPQAGRQIRRQGPLRGGRRAGGDEGARPRRPPPPRLHDRLGPHLGEELDANRGRRRRPRHPPRRQAALDHRRRRRSEGQPRPRGRHREDRRHERRGARLRRPGPRLRVRGGRLRGGQGARVPRGRGHRHPQRGPEGRPRHARDAVDHRRPLRPGHGQEGGADHRRPLLGRDARLLRRPRRPGGRPRRPDRARPRRRHDHPRRHHRRDIRRPLRRRARPPAAGLGGPAPDRSTPRARSGNTRRQVGPTRLGAVTHPGAKGEAMSMPTSRIAGLARPPLVLAACETGVAFTAPDRANVTVAGETVTIAAPGGFCIDEASTTSGPRAAPSSWSPTAASSASPAAGRRQSAR